MDSNLRQQPEYIQMFLSEIRDELSIRKINYTDLSKMCGIDRAYLTRVLNGKMNVGFKSLDRIVRVLDMKIILCLGDKDE